MIIPVKCFTCGKVLADKYLFYLNEVKKIKHSSGMDENEVIYLTENNVKKTPEGVVEILNTARKEAARNATVKNILRRNGKTATQDALVMAGLQESPTETETDPDSVVTSEEGSTG